MELNVYTKKEIVGINKGKSIVKTYEIYVEGNEYPNAIEFKFSDDTKIIVEATNENLSSKCNIKYSLK